MQTRFIIGCLFLVVCLKAASPDGVNPSQTQPLRREKRFWGILNTVVTGIKVGAKAVDVINKILQTDDTSFGRVISTVAQFDPPEKQEMYDEMEKMMKGDGMTKENTARAHMLMGALKQTMNNPEPEDTSGSSYVTREAMSLVFVVASILALNVLVSLF